jgi:hypothetical protein
MNTGQAGAVVVQVTAKDFEQLWENSSSWGLGEGSGRFENLDDGGPPTSRQWGRIYWLGGSYTAVIFARAFLAARGYEHEILFDTASDEGSNRMHGYVILTDYEEQQ